MAIPRFRLNRKAATAQGLVGLWGPGPAGSATLCDMSGWGNHGTLVNMDPAADWVVTPYGCWGLSADQSAVERVTIPHTTRYQFISGGYTLSAWVYTTDGSGAIVSKAKDGNPWNGWEWALDTFKPKLWDGASWVSATTAISSGVWAHLAMVHDGTNARFYLNGTLDKTAAHALPNASTEAVTACNRQGSAIAGNRLAAMLFDMRFWNRALSAAEIQYIYQQTKAIPYSDLQLARRLPVKAAAAAGYVPYPYPLHSLTGGLAT